MIGIGSDHGGYALKQEVIAYLKENNLEFKDFGCYDEKSCDYPEYAHAVAHAIKIAPKMDKDKIIVITISGRGDKDVQTAMAWFGIEGKGREL